MNGDTASASAWSRLPSSTCTAVASAKPVQASVDRWFRIGRIFSAGGASSSTGARLNDGA